MVHGRNLAFTRVGSICARSFTGVYIRLDALVTDGADTPLRKPKARSTLHAPLSFARAGMGEFASRAVGFVNSGYGRATSTVAGFTQGVNPTGDVRFRCLQPSTLAEVISASQNRWLFYLKEERR
jgi:hypothetical protein